MIEQRSSGPSGVRPFGGPGSHCGRRDDPSTTAVRARAREIFHMIEGRPNGLGVPSAAAIADQLEDGILASGWVVGDLIGTETALASDLAVGRRSVRQAGRILAARGVLEVRRGKCGGFRVSTVDREAAINALCADLGEVPDVRTSAREAEALLPKAILESTGPGGALALAWLKRLSTGGSCGGSDPAVLDDSRAHRIALAIARDLHLAAEGDCGVRIGSLEELCERFSSGLPVVVQAIRILEDHGLVACRRGRSGGILAHGASGGMAVRVVGAHLASCHATIADSDLLVRVTTLAAIELVHARLSEQGAAEIDAGLARMERSASATEVGLHWYLLQKIFCDAALNPVLHLLARCFAGHVILQRARAAEMNDSQARALIRGSRTIVANMKTGAFAPSRDAHFLCQDALLRSW